MTDPVIQAGDLIERALEEDLGGAASLDGDITSLACVPRGLHGRARIESRQEGVVCGIRVAAEVFRRLAGDDTPKIRTPCEEGRRVTDGDPLMEIEGSLRVILAAERTALNFLQRLSGIATAVRRVVDDVQPPPSILDTRKTPPGWRALDKYAVLRGGGRNHRTGLHDMYMVKENHIRAAGGITEAVEAVLRHRRAGNRSCAVEVEVERPDELEEALAAGAEIVMLDNFTPGDIARAVEIVKGRAKIEVSGGVHAGNLADYALPGVDYVSIGALTHSVRAFDCSLLVDEVSR